MDPVKNQYAVETQTSQESLRFQSVSLNEVGVFKCKLWKGVQANKRITSGSNWKRREDLEHHEVIAKAHGGSVKPMIRYSSSYQNFRLQGNLKRVSLKLAIV